VGEERHYYECLPSDNLARTDSKLNKMSEDYNDSDIIVNVKVVVGQRIGSDMAYTVSINGIFTLIQYNGEIDQDSAVSTYFS
jgi:hypothetical protein